MPRNISLRSLLPLLLLWLVQPADGARAAQAVLETLQESRTQLEHAYVQQLEGLAQWCEEHHLTGAAARTRRAARPRDALTLYLVTLPPNLTAAASPEEGVAPREEVEWKTRFAELNRGQAAALLVLARQAMRAKCASLAYELVLEMLRVDPDNEEGRKLLGFIKYKGEWHTPFEVEKLKTRHRWHPRFGWLPQTYVARYEAGQRYYNGKWISAEDEAKIRSDIRSAWNVQTEHYSIRTNHSLEAGVELGQRLERLYRAWQQTFAAYYASPDQLLRIFEGRASRGRTDGPRHLVFYLRDRDDYQKAIQGHVPPGIETTGIYLGPFRTAYFYATDNHDFTTLYHEASHQLFSECRESSPHLAVNANFWIIEGIACYMESFSEQEDYDTLGGTSSPRLEAARYRAVDENFCVPLAELTQMGMLQFQRDRSLPMLYSQSAGLAHFFMHYDDGRYRDALLAYLTAVYTGEDHPQLLAELTGKSYSELDAEYRKFLQELPEHRHAGPS